MFDTEHFIVEIRKRPIIYDTNHFQYNDKNAKINAWQEVGQAMLPDWDHMSFEEQSLEDKILRGKWRNIRDYFIKEYKIQMKSKPGKNKRRRYAYYHHLLFLMPIVQAKQKNVATEMVGIKIEESEVESVNLEDCGGATSSSVDNDFVYGPSTLMAKKTRYSDPVVCEASMTSLENNEVAAVQPINEACKCVFPMEENDYDKMFLLSLLPSIRQVPDQMKLKVRIQIQQVLESAIDLTADKTFD